MNISRRRFVRRTTAGLVGAATLAGSVPSNAAPKKGSVPLIVSTWPFGKPANDEALRVLLGGGPILDAIERGVGVAESNSPEQSVGLGGRPNAAGVVQLDACIMLGPGHKAGSVAGLEGIRHPISVARRVMEKTKHVMLVGEGARLFALEEGLEAIPNETRERYERWREERTRQRRTPDGKTAGHDTLAMLILAADGTIAGGCSTSGLAGKLPGRVGDSPIIGSGLYVDNEVGAAGATGVGENVMRFCATFRIVEYMRHGLSPAEACLETIRQIVRIDGRRASELSINFIALDKRGRFGAAGTDKNFSYAVTTPRESQVRPEGGKS